MIFMIYIAILFNCNKPISQRRTAWLNFLKKIVKLAWNLLSKSCANLLDFLKNFINSQEFLEKEKGNGFIFNICFSELYSDDTPHQSRIILSNHGNPGQTTFLMLASVRHHLQRTIRNIKIGGAYQD